MQSTLVTLILISVNVQMDETLDKTMKKSSKEILVFGLSKSQFVE